MILPFTHVLVKSSPFATARPAKRAGKSIPICAESGNDGAGDRQIVREATRNCLKIHMTTEIVPSSGNFPGVGGPDVIESVSKPENGVGNAACFVGAVREPP
jgi:hypothetical protein